MNPPSWLCAQIGAREHYAVARALHQKSALKCLITDAWINCDGPLSRLRLPILKRLADRQHPEIPQNRVQAFTSGLVAFELRERLQSSRPWDRIMARNCWFQAKATRLLEATAKKHRATGQPLILFSYSYAARDLFRVARNRGWRCILGQIDPGPVEEEIVAEEQTIRPEIGSAWTRAPKIYWDRWREECDLADTIVVNSEWSAEALVKTGVPSVKIRVIPLAYERPSGHVAARTYPEAFTVERPLRLLYLGTVTLRKGVARLLEAMKLLRDAPVELVIAGASELKNAETQYAAENIRWLGAVPRSEASTLYDRADAFIFPTLSDGFGLTQLEAQARKLPIIASRYCGEVVSDGHNGILLPEVTPAAIAQSVRSLIENAALLKKLSHNSDLPPWSSLDALGDELLKIDGR